MTYRLFLMLFFAMLLSWTGPRLCPAAGPAAPDAVSAAPSAPATAPAQTEKDAFEEEYTEEEDDADDPFADKPVTIADPIEPFNRAMHQVNDKLYFWLLKPVARGYKAVVPEPARLSVKNFFFHLHYPTRLVSCLLQTDFAGAATETGRFVINTVWGIGGLMDPAGGGELLLKKQDTDLGQTLGVFGVGHGFYIVWPFFGPSSPRDSVDILGNQVLHPLSFLNIWYASIITKSLQTVNSTSLRLGDYEAVIEASIDPYIAIRNGYIQYRMKEVEERRARSLCLRKTGRDAPRPDAAQSGE